MIKLDILQEVDDLRTIWPHEALDFTPWLADEKNIGLLSDAIGIDITVDETESNVGDFHVDIVATETGTDRKIIIENQLEDTNHDHLGKLITYASGKEASIIVWVVKRAREEHKAAIEWLNNHTDDKVGFFLCEIKLYKIGASCPAVKFNVVEQPNDWTKAIKQSAITNETEKLRFDYWQVFYDYITNDKAFMKLLNPQKPRTDHWFNLYLGTSLCHLSVNQIQKRDELNIEIYIDNSKEFFAKLETNKDTIESIVGEKLDWRELPNRKASRIILAREADFTDQSKWQEQFDWIVDKAKRLQKAVKQFV